MTVSINLGLVYATAQEKQEFGFGQFKVFAKNSQGETVVDAVFNFQEGQKTTIYQGNPQPNTDFYIHVYKIVEKNGKKYTVEGYNSVYYGFSPFGASLNLDIGLHISETDTPSQTPAETTQSTPMSWQWWADLFGGWGNALTSPFKAIGMAILFIVIIVIILVIIYIFIQYYRKSKEERILEKQMMLQTLLTMQSTQSNTSDALLKILPLLV